MECPVCNTKFLNAVEFKKHLKEHKLFKCDNTGCQSKGFKYFSNYQKHKLKCKPLTIICTLCDLYFKSEKLKIEHMSVKHDNLIVCDFCTAHFLNFHLKNKHVENNHKCYMCHKYGTLIWQTQHLCEIDKPFLVPQNNI